MKRMNYFQTEYANKEPINRSKWLITSKPKGEGMGEKTIYKLMELDSEVTYTLKLKHKDMSSKIDIAGCEVTLDPTQLEGLLVLLIWYNKYQPKSNRLLKFIDVE